MLFFLFHICFHIYRDNIEHFIFMFFLFFCDARDFLETDYICVKSHDLKQWAQMKQKRRIIIGDR